MDSEMDEVFANDKEMNDLKLKIIELQDKIAEINVKKSQLTAELNKSKNRIVSRKIELRRKYGRER